MSRGPSLLASLLAYPLLIKILIGNHRVPAFTPEAVAAVHATDEINLKK